MTETIPFFPVPRDSMDGPLWDETPYSIHKLWTWLISKGKYPGRAKSDHLEIGQVDKSIREIQDALEWIDNQKHKAITPGKNTIVKDLKRLEKEGMIEINAENRVRTVITVCFLEDYYRKDEGVRDTDKDSVEDSDKDRIYNKERQEEQDRQTPPPRYETHRSAEELIDIVQFTKPTPLTEKERNQIIHWTGQFPDLKYVFEIVRDIAAKKPSDLTAPIPYIGKVLSSGWEKQLKKNGERVYVSQTEQEIGS